MFRPIDGRLQITYPCTWIYKIFGTDQTQMREAVAVIIPGEDYSLTPSNSSRTGKYHCMNLVIKVSDEEERKSIYDALQGHPAIILVL